VEDGITICSSRMLRVWSSPRLCHSYMLLQHRSCFVRNRHKSAIKAQYLPLSLNITENYTIMSNEWTTLFFAFSVVLHLMLLLLIYLQHYIPTTRQIVFTAPPPSLPRLRYLKLWFTRLWTHTSLILSAQC
jgi:hypothetical protein